METLKQKPYLVVLLLLLVVARFIIVPVVEWQNDKFTRLQLLDKQLTRAQSALTNETKLKDELALRKSQLSKTLATVFPAEDENRFHLTQQQQIEALFTNMQLKVTGIGWLATKERAQWGLTLHQLQIRFEGDGVHLPAIMAQLEGLDKRIEIADFNIDFRHTSAEQIGDAQGVITLNFYMLSATPQETSA